MNGSDQTTAAWANQFGVSHPVVDDTNAQVTNAYGTGGYYPNLHIIGQVAVLLRHGSGSTKPSRSDIEAVSPDGVGWSQHRSARGRAGEINEKFVGALLCLMTSFAHAGTVDVIQNGPLVSNGKALSTFGLYIPGLQAEDRVGFASMGPKLLASRIWDRACCK